MSRILAMVMILAVAMTESLTGSDLHDHYKKGTVTLKGANDFGNNNVWETLFYDRYKDFPIFLQFTQKENDVVPTPGCMFGTCENIFLIL